MGGRIGVVSVGETGDLLVEFRHGQIAERQETDLEVIDAQFDRLFVTLLDCSVYGFGTMKPHRPSTVVDLLKAVDVFLKLNNRPYRGFRYSDHYQSKGQ
ncbi:MAG: hypothetical protein OEW48_09555 [Phycisphaerae bacterium]|nr:hypothetical protein [Phycisphaerae bacterium]